MNIRTKFLAVTTSTLLGAAVLSCGSNEELTKSTPSTPIQVQVAQATAVEAHELQVSGVVKATTRRTISTRMMGHIVKFNVALGEHVSKGATLIEIYNDDLIAKKAQTEAGIRMAQANFENAQQDMQRYEQLWKSESISLKEYENMKTRFQVVSAALNQADQLKAEVEAQLNYAVIKAPFDGVVTDKHFNVGDMATPGMPLMEFESQNAYEVWSEVPASIVNQLEKGQQLSVELTDLKLELKGTLQEIASSSINTAGQYSIRATLDQVPSTVLSGMYAKISFTHNQDDLKSILIPKSALVRYGQLEGVFTISNQNTALLRWLKLGQVKGDSIEVLSGLSAGESYIISSASKLENSVAVSVQ